jgi:uncharacterized membrane protein YbhN (UPF0104 family)
LRSISAASTREARHLPAPDTLKSAEREPTRVADNDFPTADDPPGARPDGSRSKPVKHRGYRKEDGGAGRPEPRESEGISPKARMILEAIAVYSVAGAIIWFKLREVDFSQVIGSLEGARLGLFIGATLVSFLIWFLGENLLFARMFSYFHKHTGFRELLPATAAAYFLQAINILVSNVAMLVFLRRRKGVSWVAAGFTMTFFGFIDGIMFSASIVTAGLLVPSSPIRKFVPYAGVALAAFLLIAAWWMWREPRTRFERWLRARPSLVSFRKADLGIYGELLLIRFAIMAPQGLLFWVCMGAFGLHVPLVQVLALTPLIFGVGGLPVTPAGLGFLQAVAVSGFAGLAPEAPVFAMSFAFSVAQIIYRIPLGVSSAHSFTRMVIRTGGERETVARLQRPLPE